MKLDIACVIHINIILNESGGIMSYNDPEAIIRALEENYEKARRNGDEVEMETCRREIERQRAELRNRSRN